MDKPEKLDGRHQNTGRPPNSKDSYQRQRRSVNALESVQDRFKFLTDQQFSDQDIADVIASAKELAIAKKDPKMIQFLLAKMWESNKAKEVNVSFSNADLREVLGDLAFDMENPDVGSEKS